MAGMSDLLISTLFIVLCCIAAEFARKILDRFSSIHGLVKELFLEAIAAAELCSTCFELIIGEREKEYRHVSCQIDEVCCSCRQLRSGDLRGVSVRADRLVVEGLG